MDELVDIEATFTDASGDKFSVRSCRSIGGCLAFAERPIKSVEFSLDADTWIGTPSQERDRKTRARWVVDCQDCIDASEVGVESRYPPEPKLQPWCEP